MNNSPSILIMAIMIVFTAAYLFMFWMTGLWILLVAALIAVWVFLIAFRVYKERKTMDKRLKKRGY